MLQGTSDGVGQTQVSRTKQGERRCIIKIVQTIKTDRGEACRLYTSDPADD